MSWKANQTDKDGDVQFLGAEQGGGEELVVHLGEVAQNMRLEQYSRWFSIPVVCSVPRDVWLAFLHLTLLLFRRKF